MRRPGLRGALARNDDALGCSRLAHWAPALHARKRGGLTAAMRGGLKAALRGSACGLALVLAACGATAQPDDAAIVSDFQNHQSSVEVTADGSVVRLLPDRISSTGTHERFIVKLSTGDITVEVEHNISIGARVPVKEGDHVIVHGEYIWNAQGGLIHFTHHDPQGTHESGYILDNGETYD